MKRLPMDALKRAILAFDRRLGSNEPPSRAELFVIRHPVGTGAVLGTVQGLGFAWALSGFDDPERMVQALLLGLGWGLFFWLMLRVARWTTAQREQLGDFRRPAPPAPLVDDSSPLWFEGLQWICRWAVLTALIWLIGQVRDTADSWLEASILAGVVVIGGWAARLARSRRRN